MNPSEQEDWLGLTPELLAAITSWNGPRGIVFISPDATGDAAATTLAEAIGGTTFVYDGDRGAEWKAALDEIQAGLGQEGLFQSRTLNVCVLVHRLDDKPRWLWVRLDNFMSSQPPGCIVVASARDAKNLPPGLAAFFVRLIRAPGGQAV